MENVPLINDAHKYDVILVPMGINNSMNNGFRYEVSLNFPIVKEKEEFTGYCDRRKYGTIFPIKTDGIIFIMCYIIKPTNRKQSGNDFIDYEALDMCLKEIAKRYKEKNIASPILGYGILEGNGDKHRLLDIINKYMDDFNNLTIYDYEQKDYARNIFKEIAALHKIFKEKTLTPEEYISRRSEIEWRRRYGIFKKMPDGYKYVPYKGEVK